MHQLSKEIVTFIFRKFATSQKDIMNLKGYGLGRRSLISETEEDHESVIHYETRTREFPNTKHW
jgi:hypothetical protein